MITEDQSGTTRTVDTKTKRPSQRGVKVSFYLLYDDSAWFYVLTDGHYLKIGIADDVLRRLKAIQTGHPGRIRISRALLMEKAEARTMERSMKHWLRPYRCSGGSEWFDPPPRIRKWLGQLSDATTQLNSIFQSPGWNDLQSKHEIEEYLFELLKDDSLIKSFNPGLECNRLRS